MLADDASCEPTDDGGGRSVPGEERQIPHPQDVFIPVRLHLCLLHDVRSLM